MKFKISLLLLTCIFALAQVFADGSLDEDAVLDAVTRSKKCLKANNLNICNNAAIGGNLSVAGSLTSGNETVNGTLNVTGLITAAVGLTATTGNLEATAGNVTFNPNGLADQLNAVGSIETTGARLLWADVQPSGNFNRNSGFLEIIHVPGTGIYTLIYNLDFANSPVVIVSPNGGANNTATVAVQPTTSNCTINTFAGGALSDIEFQVIVIGA